MVLNQLNQQRQQASLLAAVVYFDRKGTTAFSMTDQFTDYFRKFIGINFLEMDVLDATTLLKFCHLL